MISDTVRFHKNNNKCITENSLINIYKFSNTFLNNMSQIGSNCFGGRVIIEINKYFELKGNRNVS